MKKLINISLLLFAVAIIFNACRKDDDNEIPVKPEEAIMSFSFSEANLTNSGIGIWATPAELEGLFIDLGDGTFVPASENGLYDSPNDFVIDKPTKGKNLRVKGKVKGIELFAGNIVSMDVSQNILLEKIAVRNNISTFAQLNLTKNTGLKEIKIQSSSLASLDLSKNTQLVKVDISKSPLKQINFPADNQIEEIRLSGNQLSQIDLSQCKKLTDLTIAANPINTIDLSKNTLLRSLQLAQSNLAQLNLSANPNLTNLWIVKNKINSLALPSSLPKLERVDCYSNQLGNAQMDAFANTLPAVVASGNNFFRFACIDRKDTGEKNVISVAVVNKIKAKGWKVYDANGGIDMNNWQEYPGS